MSIFNFRNAQALCTPAHYYTKRFFGLSKTSLDKMALETVRYSEALHLASVPFYFDEKHLERIRQSPNFSPTQIVSGFFRRSHYDIPAHNAYLMQGVWLIDGSIYSSGSLRMELRNLYEKRSRLSSYSLLPSSAVTEVSNAALSGSVAGSSWFGHWLLDELPLIQCAQSLAPVVRHSRADYRDEIFYIASAGLDAPRKLETAYFKKLWIISDLYQNPDKVKRYHQIRKRIGSGTGRNLKVYLHRGGSGNSRRPINEEATLSYMQREGYLILDIESQSSEQLIVHLRDAYVVVSIEGSHMVHALYACPRDAMLVVLAPPNLCHTANAEMAAFFGLTASMYVCTPINATGSEFTVDLDELARFIDKAVRAVPELTRKSDGLLERLQV